MTKHFFAAANTPMGFVNFFEHIMPLEKAKTRYFLKGSSGSGKSTFIKKIAAEFEAMGVSIEKFHCANDPNSLDALAVPDRGLCIIDATAPHSCDPEIPVAVDKIIDFAKFLDEKKISRHIDELNSLLREKKQLREKVAEHLTACENNFLAEENRDTDKWLKYFNQHGTRSSSVTHRKLFLSAITPDGFVSFAENYFKDCEVYHFCEPSELKDKARACGINTESFCCPVAPQRLDYLHLPDLKIAFTGGFFKPSSAIAAVVESMRLARAHHAKIEEIYASAMNFEKVSRIAEKIIQKER
jgi:hypothetical protein